MSQAMPLPPNEDSLSADAPPSEVTLPPPITTPPPYAMPPQPEEDLFATTREWMQKFIDEVERINPDLPSDLAENHDHYLYGSPKK